MKIVELNKIYKFLIFILIIYKLQPSAMDSDQKIKWGKYLQYVKRPKISSFYITNISRAQLISATSIQICDKDIISSLCNCDNRNHNLYTFSNIGCIDHQYRTDFQFKALVPAIFGSGTKEMISSSWSQQLGLKFSAQWPEAQLLQEESRRGPLVPVGDSNRD